MYKGASVSDACDINHDLLNRIISKVGLKSSVGICTCIILGEKTTTIATTTCIILTVTCCIPSETNV